MKKSQAHFDVRGIWKSLGVGYIIDTNMVRSLDYYIHVFVTEGEGNDL